MVRSGKTWTWCAAGALALILTTSVQAQQGGGRRGGFGGPGGQMNEVMLLGSEKIQKELDLADEQKAEVKKIAESSMGDRSAWAGLRDLNETEREAKMKELREAGEVKMAEAKKKLEEVLLPHQRERLSQIALQVNGEAALSSDEVASKLNLTEDQKSKLKTLREEQMTKMREAFQNRGQGGQGGGDRDARREAMNKMREEMTAKVNDVLTEDQKKKFEELKGAKFEFDRRELFGGQGNRGGRNRDASGAPNGA